MELQKTQIEQKEFSIRPVRRTRGSRVDTESVGRVPMTLLVCFSGKIGNGKNSTNRMVAIALECGYASFSGYLKEVIAGRGVIPIVWLRFRISVRA